jgi:hypothetical protein
MHPDDVGSGEDGGRDGGGGGGEEETLRRFWGRFVTLRQKRFSRRPDHQRKFERGERAELREDLRVLFLAFAEAEAGIDGDPGAIHSRAVSAMG